VIGVAIYDNAFSIVAFNFKSDRCVGGGDHGAAPQA
jgi:hypothetical protein